jgi:hypothetical protein
MDATPKRSGALLRDAPASQKLRLPHSYQRCSHSAKKIERLPAGHVHFAAERCADCGCLLRWLPKPSTIERRTLNSFRIARLSMRPDLSKWEREFLASVAHLPRISPRQQEILDKLVAKFLEAKAP